MGCWSRRLTPTHPWLTFSKSDGHKRFFWAKPQDLVVQAITAVAALPADPTADPEVIATATWLGLTAAEVLILRSKKRPSHTLMGGPLPDPEVEARDEAAYQRVRTEDRAEVEEAIAARGGDAILENLPSPKPSAPMKPGPQPWNRGITPGYRLDSPKDKKKATRGQVRRVVASLKKWFRQELEAIEAKYRADLELVAAEVVSLKTQVASQRRAS